MDLNMIYVVGILNNAYFCKNASNFTKHWFIEEKCTVRQYTSNFTKLLITFVVLNIS